MSKFTDKARKMSRANTIDSEPIASESPSTYLDNGDGTQTPVFPVTYRRGGKAYLSYATYKGKNEWDIDYSIEKPVEESWGVLSGLKLGAMQSAYGNAPEQKY